MRHDERRAVHAGDALGHGERLAGPGDAEQHLRGIAALQPLDELVDGASLVAEELEVGDELELVVLGGHDDLKAYHSWEITEATEVPDVPCRPKHGVTEDGATEVKKLCC